MLIGHYFQKLSSKGRVALPSKFRKSLGQRVILARWYERSLAVFSPKDWEITIREATQNFSITKPARDTERFLLGGAYDVELDSQGRFVIPKPLRDFINAYDTVVFVGLGKRVEIWSKKLWEAREKYLLKNAEELIEQVQQERSQS